MSNSDQPRDGGRTAAVAATPHGRRRRRPAWLWLLLALLIVAIVVALSFLLSRCGSGDSPGGASAPAPGAAVPGAPSSGTGAAAPGAPPPGAGGGAPAVTAGDVTALQGRIDRIVGAQPVTFVPDRAVLTTAGDQSLQQVTRELAAVPAARIMITGYAAPLGTSPVPAPQTLSEQRAAVVARHLTDAGIPADHLQTRGAADSNPLPDPGPSRRAELSVS